MLILFPVESLLYHFMLVLVLCTYIYEFDGTVAALSLSFRIIHVYVVATCHH
jgi:hypothetical protein